MSFSGGVYTLPGPALVTGEVVSATENNQFRNDVAGAFNLTMLRNGTSTATANLPMGGYKLTGLGAPSTNGDSLAYGAAAVVTTLTSTSLTATRVPYAGTGGLLQDASTFTFDGTTLTAGGFSTSGNISAATATVSGNITVSGGTANGVAYLNGSKVLTTGSALTFDGTKLSVNGGTKGTYFSAKGTGAIAGFDTGTTNDGRVEFAYNGTTILLQEMTSASLMNFKGTTGVELAFGANNTEQMRLTSTGLGIGTSSPGVDLEVTGKSAGINSAIRASNSGKTSAIQLAAFGTGQAPVGMWNADESGIYSSGVINVMSGNAIKFATGGNTEKMRLDSSGNLGLGVTPSAWTSNRKSIDIGSVYGAISGGLATEIYTNAYFNGTNYIYKNSSAPASLVSYNGSVSGGWGWFNAGSGTAGNAISFTQAMTLDASGNLGIGTSSPDAKLEVTVGDNGGINIEQTGASQTGYLTFRDSDGGLEGRVSYDHSNNAMRFATSNTERMRIDSSGNVGIGTSSPGYKIDAQRSGSGVVARFGNGTQYSYIYTDTASVYYASNAAATNCLQINEASNFITAYTAGAERMRIDSSGNLLVGTTSNILSNSNSFGFLVNASGAVNFVNHINGTASGVSYTQYGYNGSVVGYISQNGTTAVAYNTTSDYRLKENIQPMKNALGVVAQLNPVTYTWKADGSDGQGFIAHELQAVVPDCVTGEKDAVDEEGKPIYQGIDTSFLVATLTAAIKELKAELDATKAEVAALKGV